MKGSVFFTNELGGGVCLLNIVSHLLGYSVHIRYCRRSRRDSGIMTIDRCNQPAPPLTVYCLYILACVENRKSDPDYFK